MSKSILKDLEYLNNKLKYATSRNLITYYFASYVALTTLIQTLDMDIEVPVDFDISKVPDIFNASVRKDKTRYLSYLSSTIEPNYSLASSTFDAFEESGFYPYRTMLSPYISEKDSAEYLIDFMRFMGNDVFEIFRKMYYEDRVFLFKDGQMNGLCTTAGILDSHYITYAPRCDYFDSSIVSHEIGHVIQGHLGYQRGVFGLVGSVFDETISQYMELAYIEFVKQIDKKTKEIESSVLRTHFKNTLDIKMAHSFLPMGLLYTNGVDIRSLIDSPVGFESILGPEYIDIYQTTMKEFSYAKSATYFIGFAIAASFIEQYKDNLPQGLKALKDFIATSHIGTYGEVLDRVNIDEGHMYLRKRIESAKESNIIGVK